MTKNKFTKLMKQPGILGSALAIVLTSVFAGSALATTVTVDGIKEVGEYTGTNSGTESFSFHTVTISFMVS